MAWTMCKPHQLQNSGETCVQSDLQENHFSGMAMLSGIPWGRLQRGTRVLQPPQLPVAGEIISFLWWSTDGQANAFYLFIRKA
ncbi:unnamed protein product [Leuciscus chuanchicus]